MTENLVYVDDELIDLVDGTTIAYTFQNTLPGALADRYASYTNRFNAPFTETNNRKFTHKNNEKAKQAFAVQNVKWIQNGREIISNGVIIVNKASGNYEVQILDGIVSFISLLGDEKIDDLHALDPNLITWDASTIDTKRLAVNGVVSPVISYGQMLSGFGLDNPNFTGSLSGWEQVNFQDAPTAFPELQNKEWDSSSDMAVAQLETYFDADNGTWNGYTKVIRQPYYLFTGQEYVITIDGRWVDAIPGDSQSADIYVRLYLKDGVTFKDFLVDTLTTSFADHTITITPDQDYFYFGFYAIMSYDGPGAETSSDPQVRDVLIQVLLNIGNVYLPSVWYADIINRIIQDNGYQNTGEVFGNDIYSRLIIPFCKDELKYTGLFNKCREFKARLSSPQTLTVDGSIIFNEIVTKDLYGYYDPSDGSYSQNNDYEFVIDPSGETRSFYSKFSISLDVQVNSGSVRIQVLSQGDGVLNEVVLGSIGRYRVNLSSNKFGTSSQGYNMAGGETVTIHCDLTSANITILSGEFSNLVSGINQDETPMFYACEILPELKKADLFKDFFIRFGIIPKDKNKLLTLKSFEEVIRDKANAVDWTDKRDTSVKDEIQYDKDYFQNNYFTYPSNDDSFDGSQSKGNIVCDNVSLDKEKTIYDSIFNGSSDISAGDDVDYVYVGYIPIWDTPPTKYPVNSENSFDHQPGLRLMVTRDKASDESDVKFDGNSRSDYKVANFILPGEKYLSWQAFLDDHYPSLANAIRQNKSLPRYYNLNEDDIANLDPHTLMYDDGSYFIISRIPNYIPGVLTKVELFKVQ